MTQEIMQVSPLPPFMMNALQEADYIVHDHTHIKDPGALVKVTALVGTGAAVVDKKLLSMLPNVKLIAICGVGYDGVDVVAAKEKGIVVTHTPGVLTDDVADLALGLVLSIGRRIPQADRFVRNGDWVNDTFPMTRKVTGARLGVVGMGRIGRAIAKRAAAFDMRIAYTGREAKADVPYAFYKTATALAAEVDYLVVAVPGGDGTKNLIGASVLQALGPKGYLINIARGSVVDQPVLVQALKGKAIAGAALDVFWDEPIVDPDLRRLPNVVLTPHIASATDETRQAMAALTLDNLQAFYERRALPTPVPECQ
ncbi:2-hydroxyacid dehydrogenase [Limnohabitans sp. TEGF004]|jgi:hydroxypyruvate reductase|uniref:2-hydroxyacid dehydrogenase n=1 Tax=Limnohabitans sp. TEGF004 TaxID=2986281 RepID=UPI002377997A|nr:2-hydroxyacid dehydrogenase [Limnohabitans sp. TEGF004]BDU54981.1 hydroxyacid dehydrogenase [Limnohabitans sp. TEGF004]